MGKTKNQGPDEREQKIQEALNAIREGLKGGVPAAATELFGIPRITLYYRLSGARESCQISYKSHQRLIELEAEATVRWCFESDDRRFPP